MKRKSLFRFYLNCLILIILTSCFINGQTNEDSIISDSIYIRFGFSKELFTDVNPKDAEVATEVWMKQLVKKFKGYYINTEIINDMSSIIEKIKVGKIDVISMTSLEYINIKNRIDLIPALITVLRDGKPEKYVLLVRIDKNVNNIYDLKGCKLIISKGDRGEIAKLWIDTLLLKNNLPERKKFFKIIKEVIKPSQSVLPVFFGQADACIVPKASFNTMTELNPQIGKQIKILSISPNFPHGVMCFQENCEEAVRKIIIKVGIRLHEEPIGKQILTLFRVDKIKKFNDSDLNGLKGLIKEYNSLMIKFDKNKK